VRGAPCNESHGGREASLDKGLVESAAEFFPKALWQRCMVHFYRNVFSHVPASKLREVVLLLKAIHAHTVTPPSAGKVIARLHRHEARQGGRTGRDGHARDLAYYTFPEEHWRRIRTNNPLDRIMREIRRRTRWPTKRYLEM
jgi:putative transposase